MRSTTPPTRTISRIVVGALVALTISVPVVARSAAAAQPDTAAAIHPVRPTTSDQVVVVSATTANKSAATVTAYQWIDGGWVREIGPIYAGIGKNGFTATPHEGDGYTPIGMYSFTTIFGSKPDPGTLFPYQAATSNDHWVDDPTSPVYNTWQVGPADGRWQSAETLSGYGYAAAFDFNQNPVVPDANSAIFFHAGGGATPGCIEIDSTVLVQILRWLDPAAHPVIVLGVNATPPAHLAAVQTIEHPANGSLVRF